MTACAQCGSIRLRVIGGGPLQRVIALLLHQQVVVCGRCGWTGRQRRARAAAVPPRQVASGGRRQSGEPAGGVDLAALDRDLAPTPSGGAELPGGK